MDQPNTWRRGAPPHIVRKRDGRAVVSALALWQAKTTKRRPGRKAVVY